MKTKSKKDNYDEHWAKRQRKKFKASKTNKAQRGKVNSVLKNYEKEYSEN
jgi:hypothetical protein